MIYGAGDGGEMVLRELQNNPEWGYVPIGFVDDDPRKKDKTIAGIKVFDGNGSIENLCREKDITEILISIRRFETGKMKELREICRDLNISLKRARLTIDPVEFE